MINGLIYTALTADNLSPYLRENSNGKWRVFPLKALGAPGIPANPSFPFVQYGSGGDAANTLVREVRKSLSSIYDVFVYDAPGSYKRIHTIHDIIQDNLGGVIGEVSNDGWSVTDIVFRGYGGDGFDPISQQFSKRASYAIVSSTAAVRR